MKVRLELLRLRNEVNDVLGQQVGLNGADSKPLTCSNSGPIPRPAHKSRKRLVLRLAKVTDVDPVKHNLSGPCICRFARFHQVVAMSALRDARGPVGMVQKAQK